MRILEPLLWRRFVHVQASGGSLETEDIDLDLAANEGIIVYGLDFNIHTEYTVATADFNGVVVARPSAEDVVTTIVEAQADSDFVAGFHVNVAVLTSGAFAEPHHRDWRAPEGGLTIARRMTYMQDASQTSALMSLNVWYRRVIFSDNEMVGLIIRRR